jgi:hypothetical protein
MRVYIFAKVFPFRAAWLRMTDSPVTLIQFSAATRRVRSRPRRPFMLRTSESTGIDLL